MVRFKVIACSLLVHAACLAGPSGEGAAALDEGDEPVFQYDEDAGLVQSFADPNQGLEPTFEYEEGAGLIQSSDGPNEGQEPTFEYEDDGGLVESSDGDAGNSASRVPAA